MQDDDDDATTLGSGVAGDPRASGPRPRRTLLQQVGGRFGTRAAASAPRPSRPSGGVKEIVDGIDPTERALGVAATAFAIFLALIGYFYGEHSTNVTVHSGASFFLISNFVFAFILALGVGLRRRALLGFGSLFFGLEQAFSYRDLLVGLPFVALGGWLIVRANRKQKLNRLSSTARPAARASRDRSTGKPITPKASKRYTPPRKSASSRRR